MKYIFICIFILVIVFAIRTGVLVHNWQEIAKDMIVNKPSEILDSDGETIAEIGTDRKRENINYSEIPNNLKNAYVAIEDERFYKHFGVDVKRTIAAIGSYVIHLGNASFGASTITQQLVKNLTGDDSNNISRKVNEWWKAVALEGCMSKDEILGAYLNIIYVGPNIYGVQTGAKYYFDKDVSKLSLAEIAYLAGINVAPNAYNPFKEDSDNSEKITKRVQTVLGKMRELEYITETEYNEAVAEVDSGIKFEKGNIETPKTKTYSYHTDALISEVISDLAEKKNVSQNCATNYLYLANAKIYSTQNAEIQSKLEGEFQKEKYSIKSAVGEDSSQAAMVIIDNKTGYVVGCTGGLGKKTENRIFNRATQGIRQTGSSSKPLAVVVPALDKKIITAVSTYSDEETKYILRFSDKKLSNYNKLKKAYEEKTGDIIKENTVIDYDKIQMDSTKYFINKLFNKEDFIKFITEFEEEFKQKYDCTQILVKDLFEYN